MPRQTQPSSNISLSLAIGKKDAVHYRHLQLETIEGMESAPALHDSLPHYHVYGMDEVASQAHQWPIVPYQTHGATYPCAISQLVSIALSHWHIKRSMAVARLIA